MTGNWFPTHTASEVTAKFDELSGGQIKVKMAGRLRAMRVHGGATFADLHDSTGRIQLFVRLDTVGSQLRSL